MLLDFFGDIYELIYSQLVPIPLENPASYAYVVLNFILTILATLSYSQND
jgi:hypothetical protein